jgi:hypothetical protein
MDHEIKGDFIDVSNDGGACEIRAGSAAALAVR